jgi:hypothetical protein
MEATAIIFILLFCLLCIGFAYVVYQAARLHLRLKYSFEANR